MARVIISAGHSPTDQGAKIGDLVEYDLTRKIIDALEPLLQKYPKLEMKRMTEGLSLPQKIQWINSSEYTAENNDIAVEVHINDADGTEDGVECWQAERGENASRDLCVQLLDAVCTETGMRKRTVNSEYDHPFRRLGYVHNTATISSLIEIGFMDSPKDKKILTSEKGIKKIAKGILIGILSYFDIKEGEFEKEPARKAKYQIHTEPDALSGMLPNMNSFNMPSLPNVPFPQGPSPVPMMTPEEKQENIKKLYQKVLGRNPDPQGLNYYSASQMSEEALIKLMVDSQEHKNIIKAARECVNTKALLSRKEAEAADLQSRLADKEVEIKKLGEYLRNQSLELEKINEELEGNGAESGQFVNSKERAYQEGTKKNKSHNISCPKNTRYPKSNSFAQSVIDLIRTAKSSLRSKSE